MKRVIDDKVIENIVKFIEYNSQPVEKYEHKSFWGGYAEKYERSGEEGDTYEFRRVWRCNNCGAPAIEDDCGPRFTRYCYDCGAKMGGPTVLEHVEVD